MGWCSKLAGGPGSEATLFGLLLCQRAVAPGEPAGPTSAVVEKRTRFFFVGAQSHRLIENSSSINYHIEFGSWNFSRQFGGKSFLLDPKILWSFWEGISPKLKPLYEVAGGLVVIQWPHDGGGPSSPTARTICSTCWCRSLGLQEHVYVSPEI